MAIVYPGAIDAFPVPSDPENTSLSEAGTGTRNHTEFLEDAGKAIVALESNTALRGHTHGGGDGIGSSPKLLQVNTHESADTDQSVSSIHHTIGAGPYQVAAGNHTHSYNDLLNKPLVVCTSTSRPPNPFFGQQIWETDTSRARVWSAFSNNSAAVGLYGTDTFGRVSSSDLGSSLWAQTYAKGAGHGVMATPDGNSASWIDGGVSYNRCVARRILPLDRYTLTDDQSVTFRTGTTVIEGILPLTYTATNDAILRMSDNGNSYIRVAIEAGFVRVWCTSTGMDGEVQLGGFAANTVLANQEWMATVVNRTISVYRNGTFIGSVVDTDLLSDKGTGFRGWGIGMHAGDRVNGQTTPGNVTDVIIQDVTYYNSSNKWSLQPGGQIPVLRLLQGSRQTIAPTPGSIMEWRTETEDNFGMFNPANSLTDVTVKESGVYLVNVALAWDAGFLGDQAQLGLEINGLDTPYKAWEFIRGSGFVIGAGPAGYPQTVNFSAPIRFAEGDIIRVRAKHNWSFDLFTNSATSFPRVDSRLELLFVSP